MTDLRFRLGFHICIFFPLSAMQLENLFNVAYNLWLKNETVEWPFLDLEPLRYSFLIDLQ